MYALPLSLAVVILVVNFPSRRAPRALWGVWVFALVAVLTTMTIIGAIAS